MGAEPSARRSLLIRLPDLDDEDAWPEYTNHYGPLVQRVARGRGLKDAERAGHFPDVFRAVAEAIKRYDPDPTRGSFRDDCLGSLET